MQVAGLSRAIERSSLTRDLLALGKPPITVLSVLTGAAGMSLVPGNPLGWGEIAALLLGLGLLVGGAHALNQYLERDTDALMERTRMRPLPDGRLQPAVALVLGLLSGGAALALLATFTNRLTAGLGAIALILYVLVYTPLKRRTPHALLIGAVPGAMPALMGWTAAAGSLGAPGLSLFLVLALWQVPHFIAIALYRADDYARAGIRTVVAVHGDDVARRQALLFTGWQLLAGLLLPLAGAGGLLTLVVAILAGGVMWLAALHGVRSGGGPLWARRFFRLSLIYLPAMLAAVAIDRVI